MSTKVIRLWAVLALAVFVSACTGEENDGGFGAPSRNQGEFGQQDISPAIEGALWLAPNGCWYSDINDIRRLVALPSGFTLNPDEGGSLLGPDGVIYRSGDRFDATGVVISLEEIPGSPDSRWASYATYCSPELAELVVFNTFTLAYDPTGVSDDDIAKRLASASFTMPWPCGRGWAISTSDQRLGIVIYQAVAAQTSSEVIELPDPEWTAEVLIGKNLFSEHCNDAIEQWIALPTITGRLPLTEGMITILDQLPGVTDPPAPVSAVLEGAHVDVGSIPITLPTVELHNRSFNSFAG